MVIKPNLVNWSAKPIVIVGDHEYDLPNTHCSGKGEVTYWERWGNDRGAYRCDECGQRFRLRHRPGYQAFYSLYD